MVKNQLSRKEELETTHLIKFSFSTFFNVPPDSQANLRNYRIRNVK